MLNEAQDDIDKVYSRKDVKGNMAKEIEKSI